MAGGLHYRGVADLPARYRQQAEVQISTGESRHKSQQSTQRRKGNKYKAERTPVGGITFDSKREALYFIRLKAEQAAGKIHRFHRQVVFDLPGGIRYIADFLVFDAATAPGRYVDVKGVKTPTFALKRRLVRATFGIEIELA